MIQWKDVKGKTIGEGDYVMYSETQFPGGYAEENIRTGIVKGLTSEGVVVQFIFNREPETVPAANLAVVDKEGYEAAFTVEIGEE